jgi:hypothetical protein
MKIIASYNFNRESKSDVLIAENLNRFWANAIVQLLNRKYSGDDAAFIFKAVEDDYKLYVFVP